jgi:hypothetical protein
MIRHVFMLQFTPDATDGQIAALVESARQLPQEIGTVRSFWCGVDKRLNQNNADFGIIADFDDESGWREYLEAPAHVSFAREFVAPLRGNMNALQIEI